MNNQTKKTAQDYQLIATAHHESGHAIIGLLCGMQISGLGVDSGSDNDAGYTHYDIVPYDQIATDDLFNKFLYDELYINYAGLASEKIYYKDISGSDKLPMFLKYGSWLDLQQASELIKKYNLASPGKKRFQLKKNIFNETSQLLIEYWDDVKLLAHTIYKRKKINGSDVKNLLTKKSVNKEFWKKQFKKINLIFNSGKIVNTENNSILDIEQLRVIIKK